MPLHQEITDLKRAGRLDEAYTRGRELISEHPEDRYIKNSFGWVLYEKVKELVDEANHRQSPSGEASISKLRQLLREYANLHLNKPDLLFSLLLSQTLRFPKELKFLPKLARWASVESFRSEDFRVTTGNEGKIFEPLVEKVAREVGKVTRGLTVQDHPDVQELQELQNFAVVLIDEALRTAEIQKPEWLHYNKALLLSQLGQAEEAQKLLVSIVQEKRTDFWAWQALAKVIETSDSALALALCAKACLTCNDLNFGVGVLRISVDWRHTKVKINLLNGLRLKLSLFVSGMNRRSLNHFVIS